MKKNIPFAFIVILISSTFFFPEVHLQSQEKSLAEKTPESPKLNIFSFITLTTGVLLFEAGGITSHLSFEFRQKALSSWERYVDSGAASGELYAQYSDEYSGYLGLSITSYALWGCGTAALSLTGFLFPQDAVSLSPEGKLVLSANMLLVMIGNMFAVFSGNQSTENRNLWDNYLGYLASGGESDFQNSAFYNAYQTGHQLYTREKTLSYIFWGVGGAGIVGSLLIPGKREPVAPTLLDKILITSGLALISFGNVSYTASSFARDEAEEKWDDFIMSGGQDVLLLYNYRTAYRRYTAFAISSYALWGTGGLAILTALYIPFQNILKAETESPVSLSINPHPSGFSAAVTIKL